MLHYFISRSHLHIDYANQILANTGIKILEYILSSRRITRVFTQKSISRQNYIIFMTFAVEQLLKTQHETAHP